MPRSEICEPAKAFEFISERCAIFRNASRACFEKHMKNSTVVTAYDEGERQKSEFHGFEFFNR